MSIKLSRRQILAGTVASSTLALAPFGPAFAQADSIVVTSYGGVWEEAIRDLFVADFEARTGGTAEIQIGGPPQWMSQIEASLDNPPIDVLVNTIDLALVAGRTGLVEKIDRSKLKNIDNIPDRFIDAVQGWGVIFDYGSAGIAYHKERVTNPPSSIKAMIDGALAGEYVLSLPGISYAPTPQMLIWSLADALGGSVDNVDPAFEALKKLQEANAVIFYGGATEFLNHLEAGEAELGIYWDGRTWSHFSTGAEWIGYINPEEGGVMNPVVVQKVVNSSDAAWEYIDSMLAPGPQLGFAEKVQYGVTNSEVVYPDWLKERITPWEDTRWPPFEAIGEAIPAWVDRWNREIGA
ncbi:putative spermidine/putrescine transport system substrate-binding protein [Roseovarius azorensis]|uniref:Putative spermidine/putrescine transport system substrate-binding protein n=1 Tax=Roseovarius azorensis TaxID=1287727 RepID=A0A1H7XQM1_9RHOB|nr:extracellular solute-binding protein [Roseovarius azorensis]SEM35467.1 putative spermidine/putrescine transport system substrate-binding protein [Roseovarius azorensis]